MKEVLLAIIICSSIVLTAYPSNADLQAHDYVQVTISQGDTLWQIAQEYMPDKGDMREFISSIYLINGLTQSAVIYPGQIIKVPVSNK